MENHTVSSQRLDGLDEDIPGLEDQEDAAPRMEQLPLCHQTEKTHKKSFIDDLTLLEKINLNNLVQEEGFIGPPSYHGRFKLEMPPETMILQHQLDDIVRYTAENSMILNNSKTKCLPFNNSRTKDFIPKLSVKEGEYLDVIYSLKLVGIFINSELTWNDHIEYTVKRVNSVIWQLTRFKRVGADRDSLIKFYILKIRSIIMFGAVCFHSSLTQEDSRKLELQQKRSLACILGLEYRSYSHALELTSLPRIDDLRSEACLKWAIKAQANPQHTDLFPINSSIVNTRHKLEFKEYFCHTSKFYNSAVPAMVRSLNNENIRPAGNAVLP